MLRAFGWHIRVVPHAQPDGIPAPRMSEPYNIETFGVFRDMMLQGDFTPKVTIARSCPDFHRPASAPLRMRAAKSQSPTES